MDVTPRGLLLPLPAAMFPNVEVVPELPPNRLSCGLMTLPERMLIWTTLPLETATLVVWEPLPVDKTPTLVVLPLPWPAKRFPTVEMLLEFPPGLNCGRMTVPWRMLSWTGVSLGSTNV